MGLNDFNTSAASTKDAVKSGHQMALDIKTNVSKLGKEFSDDWDYKILSWVWWLDRNNKDRRMAALGLASDDKRWSKGTGFSIPTSHK